MWIPCGLLGENGILCPSEMGGRLRAQSSCCILGRPGSPTGARDSICVQSSCVNRHRTPTANTSRYIVKRTQSSFSAISTTRSTSIVRSTESLLGFQGYCVACFCDRDASSSGLLISVSNTALTRCNSSFWEVKLRGMPKMVGWSSIISALITFGLLVTPGIPASSAPGVAPFVTSACQTGELCGLCTIKDNWASP